MTTTIELTVDLTNRAEIVKNDGLLIASKTMLDAAQRLRELDKPDTKKKKKYRSFTTAVNVFRGILCQSSHVKL